MNKKSITFFVLGGIFLAFFAILTAALLFIDVRAIGPEGSSVGFATINGAYAEGIGVNMLCYDIAEVLGYIVFLYVGFFAVLGAVQLIKRKKLFAVDREILLLGVFYAVVAAAYAAFEIVVINYRPTLIEGELEASYPSSHTLLAICVVGSAIFALGRLFGDKKYILWINIASAVLMAATVMLRTFSGVHWITDIFGGILLSFALVFFYCGAVALNTKKEKLENKSEA